MGERGWFADISSDEGMEDRWQPHIQCEGVCPSLDVWFETEEDCNQFIREQIIGKGWFPGEGATQD